MDNLLKTFELPNGLKLTLYNDSRHYYGGYYQVVVTIRYELRCSPELSPEGTDYDEVLSRLGDTIRFSKEMIRMGVPEQNVAGIVQELVSGFVFASLPYLSSPSYPARLMRSEYIKSLNNVVPRFTN